MDDRCVCCGDIIPESRQVCPTCQAKATKESLIEMMREAESNYTNDDQHTLFEAIAETMVAYGVKENGWVPIEARRPETHQSVLAYTKYGITTLEYAGSGRWWNYECWGSTQNWGITHWMPLPEPPTKARNKNG